MRFRKALGLVVVALFLAALAGTATAASLDLPKWVIVPEDSTFSDVTLFCPLDAMDVTNNVTPCYISGTLTNATIYFNSTTGYPKLVQGKILNALEFDGSNGEALYLQTTLNLTSANRFTVAFWLATTETASGYGNDRKILSLDNSNYNSIRIDSGKLIATVTYDDGTARTVTSSKAVNDGRWYFVVWEVDANEGFMRLLIYDDNGNLYDNSTMSIDTKPLRAESIFTVGGFYPAHIYSAKMTVDEVRFYQRALTDDEIKLLYLAGRKKLSEPANFRQIFSPMIDLTRDRATFYAGLEVSTSDPSGYVPVPESATNMSITSAPKLTSDYTGAPFYYEGHFWYQAQDIQYSLPIQFETVRQDGNFSHTVLLDEDKKTFVYEKEFKVINPTGARINVVYEINPLQLGFSALQYPQFELDGVRMVSWRPNNSSTPLLIATDTLEPGEVSTHWLKSTWTISKEELNFPAKLDDFRSISNWTVARKLAENAAEGKVDTYVRVIKIDSTADMSNMTVLVPLKDVKDENDVIEATALTGARDTLQVEKLSDGKVVVKVPGQDFVSGHAEIKVLYNKSGGSWFSQLLEKIRSLMKKILSMFGLGGG